jgi:predicted nucleic acid-binding protein
VTNVTDFKSFLDSSIWLGYFLGNIPKAKNAVESQEHILFTSVISLHEIYKRLKGLGKTEKEIEQAITFVEDNSIIVNLNKEIAISAAECCSKYDLHTIDSLIYSSAMQIETIFLTADNDFRNLPKTKIIETK